MERHEKMPDENMETVEQDSQLETPETFEFPFPPYKPQEEFMKKLYWALEEKKLGIFESPTGTGKSLALICGAVRWLLDHERREVEGAESAVAELSRPAAFSSSGAGGGAPDDWLAAQAADRTRRQRLQQAEKRLAAVRRARAAVTRRPAWKQQKSELNRQEAEFRELFGDVIENEAPDPSAGDDDLIDDYVSDEDARSSDEEDEEDIYHGTQIIYTSRTHSQLSQFVGEVRRSPHSGNVRVAALGSRPQLCINDTVRRLGSLSLVNQACLDLQLKSSAKTTKLADDGRGQKKQKASGSCPYKRRVEDMAAEILSEVQDIEQVVKEGRRRKACPYYASRRAVKDAQLVVVPYNNLLHAGTRAASGLRLKDSVIIVDEAHNLLETIGSIHSCQLSRRQVSDACDQLQHYLETYKKRFSPKNLLYLRQLLQVHKGILKLIDSSFKTVPSPGAAEVDTKVLSPNDFLAGAGIDNLNLRKLLVFAEKSRLVQKLRGCWRRRQVTPSAPATGRSAVSQFLREIQQPAAQQTAQPAVPAEAAAKSSDMPLMATLQLVTALSEPDRDSRLLISAARGEPPVVKFLALNAAAQFQDIVREARAVILAGGTMQPVSEFRDQLLLAAGAPADRVATFSCGHVVPPDQLLTVSLAAGPAGGPLLFNFQTRALKSTMDELGRVLLNLSKLVPAGMVCFLPSYDYAAAVLAHFTATGVMEKIAARKQVFREPRQSSQADSVLSEYAGAVRAARRPPAPTGAILFCVVGGKMSEGINFSDDLGRCVVVVGLPYPNAKSPELLEKMKFLDANVKPDEDGRSPGQVLYENLCMKAVNQSIGRAIRHKNDYACVVLCDARYGRPGTSDGLPEWIRRRQQHHAKFGAAFGQIRQFFTSMQEKFPSKTE